MITMNYPKKTAFKLAAQMKKFRAQSEENITSEINVNAQSDMHEVIREIDWNAYNEVIKQLEFLYGCQKKYGKS